jgi:hypothetical protein
MKLNGWKRIGIIASIAWVLGAGIYTLTVDSDANALAASKIALSCEDANNGADPEGKCSARADEYLAETISADRLEAAIVAFVPVPLGWGFVYLALFLVRWVRRGFASAHQDQHGASREE